MTQDNQKTTTELSRTGKTALMSVMLSNPEGSSLKEMAEALNWKENSVRGAMSTLAKSNPLNILTSKKKDGIRRYFLKLDECKLDKELNIKPVE